MTTETEQAFTQLREEVGATHKRVAEQLSAADDLDSLLEAHKWVLSILQVAADAVSAGEHARIAVPAPYPLLLRDADVLRHIIDDVVVASPRDAGHHYGNPSVHPSWHGLAWARSASRANSRHIPSRIPRRPRARRAHAL